MTTPDDQSPPAPVDVTAAEYQRLLGIAERAAANTMSRSLGGNQLDDVAAKAVWEFLRKGAGRDHPDPDALLGKIAKDRALDSQRVWTKQRQREPSPEGDPEHDGPPPPAWDRYVGSLGPEVRVLEWLDRAGDEDVDAVRAALGDLKEKDQRILFMHVLEGRPVAEIADELGLKPQTVYNRLSAAKRKLKTTLER